MKRKNKSLIIFLTLLFVLSIATSAFAGGPKGKPDKGGNLKVYDSTIDFKHFAFELNEDNGMKSWSEDVNDITNTTFNTKVIENKYIKVTLLPEYGGRIISMIDKSTGHDLLYQNPVGTPYGMGAGNFYYDWLMVYGGIFPTFPEPEHGKTWMLPWDAKVVEQTNEKISVEMSFTDDIDFSGKPWNFDNGKTGITAVNTITVYKDKSYLEMNMKLINNKNEPVKYEYWTCTTFAPGGNPSDMKMAVPIEEVMVKDDWWSWMGTVDEPVDKENHIYKYDKLSMFSNWKDMGIAYGQEVKEKWWGVINTDNNEGVVRIADNANATPGLKFWTWGYEDSYNTDPLEFGNSARPYIELWGGHSSEFFEDTYLEPNETKEWTEYYFPTKGLEDITSANENASAYLEYEKGEIVARFNVTDPKQPVRATIYKKTGQKSTKVTEKVFSGKHVNNSVLSKKIADESANYELILSTPSGKEILRAEINN